MYLGMIVYNCAPDFRSQDVYIHLTQICTVPCTSLSCVHTQNVASGLCKRDHGSATGSEVHVLSDQHIWDARPSFPTAAITGSGPTPSSGCLSASVPVRHTSLASVIFISTLWCLWCELVKAVTVICAGQQSSRGLTVSCCWLVPGSPINLAGSGPRDNLGLAAGCYLPHVSTHHVVP